MPFEPTSRNVVLFAQQAAMAMTTEWKHPFHLSIYDVVKAVSYHQKNITILASGTKLGGSSQSDQHPKRIIINQVVPNVISNIFFGSRGY